MGKRLWRLREFKEEDIDEVVEINMSFLPENYPSSFFKNLHRTYPNLFVVAERDPELLLASEKELEGILNALRTTRKNGLTAEEYAIITGIAQDQVKDRLSRLYEISSSLSAGFRFLELEGSRYFLISDRKIIGYIMCRLEKGRSSFDVTWVKRGHVVSIAVEDAYRGYGVGFELMERAMNEMKEGGASEYILEVRVSNAPAISLYKKLGFEVSSVVKRYYQDGEDAYIMAAKTH
ncbi:MAG: ribosomal protein S18-alanine N-acetyltransferase [Promethearchaeota archaeon]